MSWSTVLQKKVAPRYSNQPVPRVEQLAPSKPVLHYHTQGTIPEAPHDYCAQNWQYKDCPVKHAPYTVH